MPVVTRTEPWLYWVQAAVRHREHAQQLRATATFGGIGGEVVRATVEEISSAMQSVVASAFAIDGFDSAVNEALENKTRSGGKDLLARLEAAFNVSLIAPGVLPAGLQWLVDVRNAAVHGDVRDDPGWRHPSGVTVSAVARDFSLENASRGVDLCADLLRACLGSSMPDPELGDWISHRRSRLEEALKG